MNLKENLGVRKTSEPMSAEAPEPEAGRGACSGGRSGGGGHDNLPPVGRRADAGRRVNGQADVPDIRECRVAAMNTDTQPHLQSVGPGAVAERPLDGHRGLDSRRGTIEDREELVGTRID